MLTTPPASRAVPPARAALLPQVARLDEVDATTMDGMRREALRAPRGVIAYGEFQSGGWWTSALMNHSGAPEDTVIGDGRPRPTTLLEQMPTTAAFLTGLGLELMFVRLARLAPHSYLWEHRDYAELHETGRYRLHVPLATNPSSVLVTAGRRTHMASGALWRLTPTEAHGVCNPTGPDRLHLIADVYADDAYEALAVGAHLRPGDTADLPQLTDADRERLLTRAARLAALGFITAAEHSLLRAFYAYDMPEGTAYDLIAELHTRREAHEEASRWRADKAHLLAHS
jgi:hypothetical protein